MTLAEILTSCFDHWIKAKHQKKHPFRYFMLSTVNEKNQPKCRMVVLRGFDKNQMAFSIFTDTRSQKVAHLERNPEAQLLFYDARRLKQIVVSAKLKRHDKEPDVFKSLPEHTKKDYSTVLPPGSRVESPTEVHYDDEKYFFSKLTFYAYKIEVLQLQRPQHLRCVFQKNEAQWDGIFLTP